MEYNKKKQKLEKITAYLSSTTSSICCTLLFALLCLSIAALNGDTLLTSIYPGLSPLAFLFISIFNFIFHLVIYIFSFKLIGLSYSGEKPNKNIEIVLLLFSVLAGKIITAALLIAVLLTPSCTADTPQHNNG